MDTTIKLDLEEVKKAAREELYKEKYDAAVKAEVQRLKTQTSLWDRLFPYKILIVKKK